MRPIPWTSGVVLAYHDVHPGSPRTSYDVTPTQLASHLRWLRRVGRRVVPLAQLVDDLARGGRGDGMAALTFDDALAGVLEHALPVLSAEGVPATVFVVTEGLGASPPWWPGSGPTMSSADLDGLVAAGVDLGSHTRTHRSLPALDDHDLVDELVGSRQALEDRAGRPVTLFAYPDGHQDLRVRTAVERAGYDAAFTFLNGRVSPSQDRFRLPRLTMGSHHRTLRVLSHLLRPARTWPDTQLERT